MAKMYNDKRILVVVAHHDDEVLGCGGTLYKESQKGATIELVVISDGRGDQKEDCFKSAKVLGIQKVHNMCVQWNKLDSIPITDMIKYIKAKVIEFKPDILLTHDHSDLNKEHKLVYEAVMVATRPIAPPFPNEVVTMPVISSQEYNYEDKFKENLFIELDEEALRKKQEALACYCGELREYPNPRSAKGIEIEAMYIGKKISKIYAEEFRIVRNIQDEL